MTKFKDLDEFQSLRELSIKHQNIVLELGCYEPGNKTLSKIKKKEILANWLSIVRRNADVATLYGQFSESDLSNIKGADYIKLRGKIQINDDSLEKYFPIMNSENYYENPVTLVFSFSDRKFMDNFIEKCYEPTVYIGMQNFGVKSAFRYAKSNVASDRFFAVWSNLIETSYMRLTIVAEAELLQDFVTLVGEKINLSNATLKEYGLLPGE